MTNGTTTHQPEPAPAGPPDEARSSSAGGWLLASGGLAYFLFQWSATTLAPGWFEDNPLSGFWPASLGLHALALSLIIGGMWLIGLGLGRRHESTGLWWAAMISTFLGLTMSHPLFSAGMVLVAVFEYRVHRRRLVPLLLVVGGLLWLYVFLAGAHLGDENSRAPVGLERWAALFGLAAMCCGLVMVGITYVRSSSHPPSVAGSFTG